MIPKTLTNPGDYARTTKMSRPTGSHPMPDLRAAREWFERKAGVLAKSVAATEEATSMRYGPYIVAMREEAERYRLAAAALALMEAAPDPETLGEMAGGYDDYIEEGDDVCSVETPESAWLRACAAFLRGEEEGT